MISFIIMGRINCPHPGGAGIRAAPGGLAVAPPAIGQEPDWRIPHDLRPNRATPCRPICPWETVSGGKVSSSGCSCRYFVIIFTPCRTGKFLYFWFESTLDYIRSADFLYRRLPEAHARMPQRPSVPCRRAY